MMALVKELELARQRMLALERKVDIEQQAEEARLDSLANLPGLYGFGSVEAFERAIREAAGEVLPATPSSEQRSFSQPLAINGEVTSVAPAPVVAQGIQASRAALAQASATPPKESPPETPPAPASAPVAAAPAKPLPTGTSLSDPTNFGQLPDETLLDRGTLAESIFRSRLNAAQTFAQQVLHTSKVPAAVWRAWRDFAKKTADALRAPVASQPDMSG